MNLITYTPDTFDNEYPSFFEHTEEGCLKIEDREPLNHREWGIIDDQAYSFEALEALDLIADETILATKATKKAIHIYNYTSVNEVKDLDFTVKATAIELLKMGEKNFFHSIEDHFYKNINPNLQEIVEIDLKRLSRREVCVHPLKWIVSL